MRISGWSSDVCSSDLRLFRADRDADRDRDDIAVLVLEALHESLCDIARIPRAAAAFGEAFPALREHSRLHSVWMLLFAYGSITPAQLADRKSTRLNSSH